MVEQSVGFEQRAIIFHLGDALQRLEEMLSDFVPALSVGLSEGEEDSVFEAARSCHGEMERRRLLAQTPPSQIPLPSI